jgi:predicted nucleic acid-binding protein
MGSDTVLVDTSGFFALLNEDERDHPAALRIFKEEAQRHVLVTTEHVLVETATLLRARGTRELERKFFALLDATKRIRVVWASFPFFTSTREFFLKHQDKGWSFVDCASFVLMREEGLKRALSTDKHFRQAGFVPLLKA